MDMYILGIAAGLLVVVVLIFVLARLLWKTPSGFSEKAYDERQQKARAISFKSGFFTLLIYNLLYGLSGVILKNPWCDVMVGCFIGILISVTVFAVVSIFMDAYIPVKDTLRRNVILFAVIAVLNALPALRYLFDPEESMIINGVLNFRCMNLLVTVMLLIVLSALLIKRTIDERASEE